jgi:hypothetical protein
LLLRLLSSPVRAACVFSVALFLWCVAQFYHPDTGFTSLISIGDEFAASQVSALRRIPHYVYEGSPGYDGAYYVQIALHPTLDNPELNKRPNGNPGAIDNLPYRARRILFSWTAWLFGLGQPTLIVQAFALLNVASWLGLAWVLLHWFPATNWENFLRWFAILFSHGLCMSVRNSLVDGPALLLVALALRWVEEGRRVAGGTTLALAGLGRETSLLAAAGLDFDPRAPRTWLRTARVVALIAVPLLAWMLYVRLKFGPAEDPGLGNFTYPFAGFVEKVGAAWSAARSPDTSGLHWATVAAVIALGVQWLFFAVRWRPAERWWRVGAVFACLMIFLSTPVWEGFPGASTRALLPMTLAFNVLMPRGVRWLPWLIAGNLTVAASFFEFSPPHEFYQVRGDNELRAAVHIKPTKGWHGPERHLEQHWRWSSGRSELRVTNDLGQPVLLAARAQVISADATRSIRVMHGENLLWADAVGQAPADVRFGLTVPPGETVLVFTTDRPAQKVGTDPRDLAFQVANLEIVLRRPGASR